MSSLVGQLEIVTTRELPGSIRSCVTSWVDVARGVTPVRTLADCAADADHAAAALASRAGDPAERASFRVAASPATPVPQTALVGGVDTVHQALLTMDRAALESFLRARLGAGYYASPGVLNEDGITLVSNALFEVFSTHGSYRTQFCRPLRYDPSHSPPYGMLVVGNIDGVTALIVTPQIGAGLVIDRLQITVRHDDDGIALAAQQHCPP